MSRLMCCVISGVLMVAVPAVAQPVSDTNMEILKEKLKADKKLLIAGNMDLSDAEAKQFWPLYRLAKILGPDKNSGFYHLHCVQ